MTEKEKRTILDMRAAGKQYKEISAELGIEVSALKVFMHRQKHNDVRRCEQCKKVLPKDARKTQRFCSDKCRKRDTSPECESGFRKWMTRRHRPLERREPFVGWTRLCHGGMGQRLRAECGPG